jgi:uroporphyrinogen-III synthase
MAWGTRWPTIFSLAARRGSSARDPFGGMADALTPGAAPVGPLAGLGILVTRPARQAAGFAQKVAALGGTPVIFPAIAILPPADPEALRRAHDALRTYDIAIFVSANAVEYGAPDPRRWPARLAVYAPGPGTADVLAAAGIAGARIPATTFDSEGLLALPELADVRGKRVLILRGDGGREHLGDTLRARGAQVDYASCYRRAVPQSGGRGLAEAFRDGRIDAVTLTSSEGLDNLWSLADDAVRAEWRRSTTFVPHARIAARARDLGLAVVTTAGGDAGLLAGLLEWAAAQPR